MINDGNRHTKITGYGNLSRAIMSSLVLYSDADIATRFRDFAVPEDVPDKALLDRIPVGTHQSEYDCVLQISQPPKAVRETKPTLIYTQNALGELKPEWQRGLSQADGVIVPSRFDADVFRRHCERVYVCHQYVDDVTFKPARRFREEGPDRFSFMFVGSFGYRKGVDLLLQAFAKAFGSRDKVNLTLHCFMGLERDAMNRLIAYARNLPPGLTLSVYVGTVSPAWMARYYNRHDCVVSFSRGEGWCMPLHEAMLCGKPVIAADSTAMGECLPDSGCIKVKTHPRLISEITDPWGQGTKQLYATPGAYLYEVDIDAAAKAMRRMYKKHSLYEREALNGRAYIRATYSRRSMSNKIMSAVNDVLGASVLAA